jgi:mannose-6-phosphate isomerase
MIGARRLEPRFIERVWGVPLPSLTGLRIGEVCYEAGPILVKFLFTAEPLSVQVHPGDDYAAVHEDGSAGKTEMWHVLAASPTAWIQLGFQRTFARADIEPAVQDGSVCGMLNRLHPSPGDTYFVPAGTVHALGPGLVICEIQQTSGITYRLFDYGRGRRLDIEKGLDVAFLGPHPGKSTPAPLGGSTEELAACRYFATERWSFDSTATGIPPGVWIVMSGSGTAGDAPFDSGSVFETVSPVTIRTSADATLLRTYVPPATRFPA